MRIVRVLGWILLGVVIGVLGNRGGETVHAQYLGLSTQRLFDVGDTRGKFAQPRVTQSAYTFVKDSESGGCWLKLDRGDAIALAPAPESACK